MFMPLGRSVPRQRRAVSDRDRTPVVDPALCTPAPSVTDALDRPDETAAALVVLEPGGESTARLLQLIPARLSDAGLIDALVASELQVAAVQARQQLLLAELARRDPDGQQYLRDEVACALRVAPGTAHQRLEVASAVTGRLWDTYERLERGELSYVHAKILATAVEPLSDKVTAQVQQRVLPAAGQTPGEFRAAVRRAVARFDTRNQTERHAVAYADRKVVHYPEPDAMASIWLHLAADGAATIMTAINACARRTGPDDTRTADQRRADAAVEISLAALDNPQLPTTHRLRPAVAITIADTTLHGLDEQPAELDGYGPIPATMARRIAAQPGATHRYWLVDSAGRLLDQQPLANGIAATGTTAIGTAVGISATDAYQPTAAITRQIIARDQHCIHPGCRRQARHSELDHRIPWPYGPTTVQNMQALCKRHHDLKHHSRWHVTKTPDGDYHWTSPTGHRYRYRPPELPVPVRETAPVDAEPPPY